MNNNSVNTGLFKNKYRISSSRLKGWDYSTNGYYFVTIVTKNRISYFGTIRNKIMHIAPIGKIIVEEWKRSAIIRQNILLDAFVIMPNHIHMIIIIRNLNTPGNASQLQKNSISNIIRGFKSTSTKRIHMIDSAFRWQSRFYDQIIRNEMSLHRIRLYIQNNPYYWDDDEENPDKF